jgi:predicted CoA-binding protein
LDSFSSSFIIHTFGETMILADKFIKSPKFAVIGASTSRTKYGNKVLRWYQTHGLTVIPVHPVSSEAKKRQKRQY